MAWLGLLLLPLAGLAVLLAAVLAALSSSPLDGGRAVSVVRSAGVARAVLLGLMGAWAALSLAEVAPLDDPTPAESGSLTLTALAVAGVALYALAAVRYLWLWRRHGAVLLAVVVAAFGCWPRP